LAGVSVSDIIAGRIFGLLSVVHYVREGLNEVALTLELEADATVVLVEDELTESDEQRRGLQDQVDQVYTIFAILVGVASIAIAVLLGTAVRVRQSVL
jgi:hypothetical protein